MLVGAAAIGGGSFFGGWFGGLTTAPAAVTPYTQPMPLSADASPQERVAYNTAVADYEKNMRQWRDDTPKAARSGALLALTGILLGLVGAVVGGWAASGEPMTFTYYKRRAVRH